MSKVTVVVLTKNEEQNIVEVINNAKKCADKVLIVDSGSTDKTVELAKTVGAQVIYRAWDNDLSAQRNFALDKVETEWVLYLDADERLNDELIDAIKKAGGETKQADLSQVNLAYELQDGQKIYIPNKNEKISKYIVDENGNTNINSLNSKEEEKVNINTANQSELDSLPGIGPATAQKIIEYRNQNGNFKKIEDLQNVKGIGQAKYEEIRNNIEV